MILLYIVSRKFTGNLHINIFSLLGGVKNCGKEISKPYALEEGTNLFDLTLCGNPQPKLFYTFQGKTEEAKMIQKLDDSKKMYKYKIEFEKIDRKVCGSTLEFKATGFKDWQASSIIQVNCKNYFLNFLFQSYSYEVRFYQKLVEINILVAIRLCAPFQLIRQVVLFFW